MSKTVKTILIISIAVFGGTLLLFNPSQANANGIVITPEPVFNVDNFFPGQSVTSVVKITNNSGNIYETITLSGQIIKEISNLASALKLKVDDLPEIDMTSLLNENNLVSLGSINNGATRTFNFTMRFNEGGKTDNQYQDGTLIFNFIFLFENSESNNGQEAAVMGVLGGGGGRIGVSGDRLLTASKNKIPNIWFDCSGVPKAYIQWQTNIASNGRILYIPISTPFKDPFDEQAAPDYGYSTTNWETSPNNNHLSVISGLAPGRQYAYRFQALSGGKSIITPRDFFTVVCVAGSQIVGEENNALFVSPATEQKGQKLASAVEIAGAQDVREKTSQEIISNGIEENQEKSQNLAKEQSNVFIIQFVGIIRRFW